MQTDSLRESPQESDRILTVKVPGRTLSGSGLGGGSMFFVSMKSRVRVDDLTAVWLEIPREDDLCSWYRVNTGGEGEEGDRSNRKGTGVRGRRQG